MLNNSTNEICLNIPKYKLKIIEGIYEDEIMTELYGKK